MDSVYIASIYITSIRIARSCNYEMSFHFIITIIFLLSAVVVTLWSKCRRLGPVSPIRCRYLPPLRVSMDLF